jgi:geranylgeranyl pyrophosphate synthase
MDGSALRRGHASAHVQFARWHRDRGLSGSPERFGESAAVLLGDLCLVWAEQMLRDSSVDQMRTELLAQLGGYGDAVGEGRLDGPVRSALLKMASVCAQRAA